jgi:hypothetical protein
MDDGGRYANRFRPRLTHWHREIESYLTKGYQASPIVMEVDADSI